MKTCGGDASCIYFDRDANNMAEGSCCANPPEVMLLPMMAPARNGRVQVAGQAMEQASVGLQAISPRVLATHRACRFYVPDPEAIK